MATPTPEELTAARTAVATLNGMIESGERQTVIAGESVLFNTTESLIKARNDAQDRLNVLEARAVSRRRSKVRLLSYGGRGYNDGGY